MSMHLLACMPGICLRRYGGISDMIRACHADVGSAGLSKCTRGYVIHNSDGGQLADPTQEGSRRR